MRTSFESAHSNGEPCQWRGSTDVGRTDRRSDARNMSTPRFASLIRFVRTPEWSSNRCNWMGATTDSAGKGSFGVLGPHLLSGTSGVALFLAELYAATRG